MNIEFIKNSSTTFLTKTLILLKGLFIIPILIKFIGVAEYGSYVLAISLLTLVSGFSSLGVFVKNERLIPSEDDPRVRSILFYEPLFFHLFVLIIISILFYVFEPIIYKILGGNLVGINTLVFYLLSNSIFTSVKRYLRFKNKISLINIISLVQAYFHIALIFFFYYNYNHISVNLVIILESIIISSLTLLMSYYIFKDIGITWSVIPYNKLLTNISIGFPLTISLITDFIISGSDRFILELYLGVYSVGVYSPSFTIATLIMLIPKSLGIILPQLLSRTFDKQGLNEAKVILFQAMKFFCTVSIPLIVYIYFNSFNILTIFANKEIANAGEIISLITSISVVLLGMNLIMTNVLMVNLKTKNIFKINLAVSLVNIALNLILLKYIKNINIPAFTTLLAYFLSTILILRTIDKSWLQKEMILVLIKNLFLAIIIFIIIYLINNYIPYYNRLIDLAVNTSIYIILFLSLVFILRIYTVSQIRDLIKVIKP